MKIRIFDNFLSDDEQDQVMDYCENEARYKYGESDDGTTPACGVTHNIPKDSFMYKLFAEKTKSLDPKRYSFV